MKTVSATIVLCASLFAINSQSVACDSSVLDLGYLENQPLGAHSYRRYEIFICINGDWVIKYGYVPNNIQDFRTMNRWFNDYNDATEAAGCPALLECLSSNLYYKIDFTDAAGCPLNGKSGWIGAESEIVYRTAPIPSLMVQYPGDQVLPFNRTVQLCDPATIICDPSEAPCD